MKSHQPDSKQWLHGFAKFLQDISKHRQTTSFHDVISLDMAISKRIGFGGSVKEKVEPFLALQPFDYQWFSKMPWQEAILEAGAIVFIANPSTEAIKGPLFGLRIPINPDYTKVLSRFNYLDVREIEIDSSGSVTTLGETIAMKVPISRGNVERLGYRPKISKNG